MKTIITCISTPHTLLFNETSNVPVRSQVCDVRAKGTIYADNGSSLQIDATLTPAEYDDLVVLHTKIADRLRSELKAQL